MKSQGNQPMTNTDAIRILSLEHGAYGGTYVVPACSGNLIEDIMNEGDVGKTFHRFGGTVIVEDSSLIPLAKFYQREHEEQMEAIADLVFS
jgi:hypothetical protein